MRLFALFCPEHGRWMLHHRLALLPRFAPFVVGETSLVAEDRGDC